MKWLPTASPCPWCGKDVNVPAQVVDTTYDGIEVRKVVATNCPHCDNVIIHANMCWVKGKVEMNTPGYFIRGV